MTCIFLIPFPVFGCTPSAVTFRLKSVLSRPIVMEVVGLVAGFITLPILLLQLTERLMIDTQHLAPELNQVSELPNELRALHRDLLSLRDLVERQATEDASPALLSALVDRGSTLRNELETTESLILKTSKSSHKILRLKRTLPELQESIERIKSSRSALHLILQSQLLLESRPLLLSRTKSATSEHTATKSSIIAEWLDQSSHNKVVAEHLQIYHPGSGDWVLSEPSFRNWMESSGRLLWCSGSRKSCLRKLRKLMNPHIYIR